MNFGEWTRMERWHYCWERRWRVTCNRVMVDVGECVLYWLGDGSREEAIVIWVGCCWILVLLSLFTSDLLEQLDTAFNCWMTFYLVCHLEQRN